MFGPQDQTTLEAEAVAARLKHAQPDGAAAGAAELRDVVERMGEFLGAAHQFTVKWQGVLERMSAPGQVPAQVPELWHPASRDWLADAEEARADRGYGAAFAGWFRNAAVREGNFFDGRRRAL